MHLSAFNFTFIDSTLELEYFDCLFVGQLKVRFLKRTQPFAFLLEIERDRHHLAFAILYKGCFNANGD